jgi:hypothetical protein
MERRRDFDTDRSCRLVVHRISRGGLSHFYSDLRGVNVTGRCYRESQHWVILDQNSRPCLPRNVRFPPNTTEASLCREQQRKSVRRRNDSFWYRQAE